MMYVNQYKVRTAHLSGTSEFNFEIPINQTPWLLGQSDIINEKFVKVSVEESINPTFDYEKVRFVPIINGIDCDFITYRLKILDNGAYINTTWDTMGFIPNDIRFKKNNYSKSHLRLDFYDTDIGTKQQLLFFKTIFSPYEPTATPGTPVTPANLPLNFRAGNTLKDRTREGEGFFLYYFKEDVLPTVPTELYMRATFQNAKDGKSTTFMSSSNPNIEIDDLAKTESGMLYTRYLLKRNPEGYYYELDDTYSNNIVKITGAQYNYNIDLYEISVL